MVVYLALLGHRQEHAIKTFVFHFSTNFRRKEYVCPKGLLLCCQQTLEARVAATKGNRKFDFECGAVLLENAWAAHDDDDGGKR